jgi:hypothetical protein
MYVQRNIEARSRNHCCRGKAKFIKYYECVIVALVTQHTSTMSTLHVIVYGLLGLPYFFTWNDFRGGVKSYWMQNVFWFSLQVCLKHFSY